MPPTIVKDSATAEIAAMNLDKGAIDVAPKPGEPSAPRQKTTSETLFPEFTTDDGGIINRPIKAYEDAAKALPSVPATPPSGKAPTTQVTPAPTNGILDLSKLPDDTMVRMKVDGVEIDVPAQVAKKNMQLERHLSIQAEKLAAERKALEAEREALRRSPVPPAPQPAQKEVPPAKDVPADARDAQILALQAQLARVQAFIEPQMFDQGVKRLAERAKVEFGSDDFQNYLPQIKGFVDSELSRPEVRANPEAVRALDNPNLWYDKYKDFKLQELIAKTSAPAATPAAVTPVVESINSPAGTTVIVDREGKPVVMPNVESSGGAPAKVPIEDEWQARYQAAFAKAKASRDSNDWKNVFALKREIAEAARA